MVTRSNQWYPRTNNDRPLKLLDYQPPKIGVTPQNKSQPSNTLLSPTKSVVAREQTMFPTTANEIISIKKPN